MKKLFKWLVRLFLALVLLILLLILFLDPIAKYVAERQIRQQTGLAVMIGKVFIGLRNPTLDSSTRPNSATPYSSIFPNCWFSTTSRLFAPAKYI